MRAGVQKFTRDVIYGTLGLVLIVFLGIIAVPASALAQEPPSVIEPAPGAVGPPVNQRVPLRVDALAHGEQEVVRLWLQCGGVIRPLTIVEGGVVATTELRLVSLCMDGHMIVEGERGYSVIPLADLTRMERNMEAGAVLVCSSPRNSALVVVRPEQRLPWSCEDVGGWTP